MNCIIFNFVNVQCFLHKKSLEMIALNWWLIEIELKLFPLYRSDFAQISGWS